MIVFSVCLNERVTTHMEAYENLLWALLKIHEEKDFLFPTDYICYNIGSPMLNTYLKTDLQRMIPEFDVAFQKYGTLMDYARKGDSIYGLLQSRNQANFDSNA